MFRERIRRAQSYAIWPADVALSASIENRFPFLEERGDPFLRIGGIAAAEVIGHYGARPERDLAALVADRLG